MSNHFAPTSKSMRMAWIAFNPGIPSGDLAAEFSAWIQSEKADAWALGADHQARQDGALPDWVWNPYNRTEARS